jgi:hypothetical protein
MSWGMWRCMKNDATYYGHVSVDCPDYFVTEGDSYIGIADYAHNRWDIRGPVQGDEIVDLDFAKHRSPGGSVYVVVIASVEKQDLSVPLRVLTASTRARILGHGETCLRRLFRE